MIKVHKDKIPSHLSFALKTSMLEMALNDLGFTAPVELHYTEPESTGALFEAQYRSPNAQYTEFHLHIAAGAVPSQSRQEMATLLKESILLEFMVWLEEIQSLAPQSPRLRKQPVFHATFRGGQLHLSRD